MFQSRDQIRHVYLKVWHKIQNQTPLEPMEAIIADVIELHPEYHPLLDNGNSAIGNDFSPEDGQTNPFLHMGMHITLREQTGSDRPYGIQAIFNKLVQQKGIHETEHAMMECLGQVLWNAQRNNQMPDEKAYLNCLGRL